MTSSTRSRTDATSPSWTPSAGDATILPDARAVVAAWHDALNRHDPDAVAGCFADRCAVMEHGTGRRLVGRTAVRDAVAGWIGAVGELWVEGLTVLELDGGFATEWMMGGVHTGELLGRAATGRSFAVNGATLGEVVDGEIVSAALYWNVADLLTQVGVDPLVVR